MEVIIENKMTKRQAIVGFVYLPFHIVILPLLLPLLGASLAINDATANLIYYGIGILFTAVFMMPFLRRCFDFLVDNTLVAALIFFSMMGVYYLLSLGVNLVVEFLELPIMDNPNDANVETAAMQNLGLMKSISIFMAPIVEEILFRGVVFGSIRGRSRVLAYVVSAALFAIFHVWGFVYATHDPRYLILVVEYIPVAVALAYSYDKTGCIWLPIGFHMLNNAAAFALSGM